MNLALLLDSYVTELEQHDLAVNEDVDRAARENLHTYSFCKEHIEADNAVELLSQFLTNAVSVLQAKGRGAGISISSYAWHDAMAGQLRISACRATNDGKLPFGCTVVRTAQPTDIVQEYVNSTTRNGIPSDELQLVDDDALDVEDDEDQADFHLTVYAIWT